VDAWSARDTGNLGLSDEEQLEYAIREQAVIFTHDDDFLRLAHDWTQHKHSIGECIRRLMDYALILEADDMKNRVEFL
jgi:hypothetical protein